MFYLCSGFQTNIGFGFVASRAHERRKMGKPEISTPK